MDIRTVCVDFNDAVAVDEGYRFPFSIRDTLRAATVIFARNIVDQFGRYATVPCAFYHRLTGTMVLATTHGNRRFYSVASNPTVLLSADPD